jgi:hypothetical protein
MPSTTKTRATVPCVKPSLRSRQVPQRRNIPHFPLDTITGSLGDLARLLARDTEVPEEFVFAAALTAVGSQCAGKLTLNVHMPVDTRLYTVLLGKSYEVRKSSAEHRAVEAVSPLLSDVHILNGIGSAEGLAKVFTETKHVLVTYDELRAFCDKARVQSSVLLPMVTSLFEATDWDNPTKYSHVSVRGGHLSILGCCTEDTYGGMWTAEAVGMGFPSRLFVVWADRKPKVAWPSPVDPERLAEMQFRIKRQLAGLPLQFDIAPDAKELWKSWYHSLPNSEHANRLDTLGFRLMPLLALTTDKDRVDLDTVQCVVKLLDYEFAVRRATDPIGVDNKVAELQEKIRRVLGREGLLPRSRLSKLVNARRCGTELFNRAVKGLLDESEVLGEPKGPYRLNEQFDGESRQESGGRLPTEAA